MSASDLKSLPSIGFLTVGEYAPHGLLGGYLVLNMHGRPLEFHCTSPVKPTRAQEILYGPTLRPFLYGEQIGQTLIAKSRIQPDVVCTDVEPAINVHEYVQMPVMLVHDEENVEKLNGKCSTFEVGSFRLSSYATAPVIESTREHLLRFLDHAELLEPFGRIREALDEARAPKKAA